MYIYKTPSMMASSLSENLTCVYAYDVGYLFDIK